MGDETNLIVGTFLFAFNPATKPESGANLPSNYSLNFGELIDGSLKPAGDVKEQWDSVGGVLLLLDAIKTKRRLDFEAGIRKLDPATLALYMGSSSGSAPMPGVMTKGYGYLALQCEGEPVVTAEDATNKGAAVFAWYGFACSIYLDGNFDAKGEDYSDIKLSVVTRLAIDPGLWAAGARPVVATTGS